MINQKLAYNIVIIISFCQLYYNFYINKVDHSFYRMTHHQLSQVQSHQRVNISVIGFTNYF